MRGLLLFCCLSLLNGCTSSVDEPITRAYGKAVRDLGIFPVFPPREEFQVGDVYTWSQSESDPSDNISSYVTSLHWMRHEASNFLRSRVVFQNSQVASGARNPLGQSDLPNSVGKIQTRGELSDPSLVSSLPITALPRVSADAGFTSGLGLVNLLSSVGLTGGARTTVTLDFSDVRTYWVPNVQVVNRVDAASQELLATYANAAMRDLTRSLQLRSGDQTDPCGSGRVCGLSVITRVYLTRQINYTYRNGRIVAAGLRRSELVADDGTATRPPSAPSVVVNVETGADGTIDGAQTDAQIAALQGQLAALSESTDRGQSLQFEAWDARGLTFRQIYQRPVAVAWDGIDYEISALTSGG